MDDNNKRTIPRHVDGRVLVGLMPIKNFIKALVLIIIVFAVMITHFTPVTLFVSITLSGCIIGIYSEFNNRETGLDILKSIIRYKIRGNVYFERGDLKEDGITERFIRNKIR